eukprot:365250-Chlamydomonas_euryale.AAC.6
MDAWKDGYVLGWVEGAGMCGRTGERWDGWKDGWVLGWLSIRGAGTRFAPDLAPNPKTVASPHGGPGLRAPDAAALPRIGTGLRIQQQLLWGRLAHPTAAALACASKSSCFGAGLHTQKQLLRRRLAQAHLHVRLLLLQHVREVRHQRLILAVLGCGRRLRAGRDTSLRQHFIRVGTCTCLDCAWSPCTRLGKNNNNNDHINKDNINNNDNNINKDGNINKDNNINNSTSSAFLRRPPSPAPDPHSTHTYTHPPPPPHQRLFELCRRRLGGRHVASE